MSEPTMTHKAAAEVFGTFWLTFGGCGSAVIAANFGGANNPLGIGLLGVSLAFGLTVVTMAYAVGHISGGHFNPAVTLGAFVAGRIKAADVVPYWIAQLVGGVLAGGALYAIASGAKAWVKPTGAGGFATNGFGDLSPGGYSLVACFVAEVLLTAMFLLIILGSTSKKAPAGFAPMAIGLGLVLVHLISIPITNTSVNPARSLGVALFGGTAYIKQLWMFFLAPLIGAGIGGSIHKALFAPVGGDTGEDSTGGGADRVEENTRQEIRRERTPASPERLRR
jgi:aquaporin Z